MAVQSLAQSKQEDTQARSMLGCSECAEGEIRSTSGSNPNTPDQQAEAVASAMQQVMEAYDRGKPSQPPVTSTTMMAF